MQAAHRLSLRSPVAAFLVSQVDHVRLAPNSGAKADVPLSTPWAQNRMP
jgi:hypothetical protein